MSIRVDDGATERVVDDDRADLDFEVTVRHNPVRLSHIKQQAPKGREYAAGKTFALRDLNGEALFAHAPDGPVVLEMDEATFLADLFPEPPVEPHGIQVEASAGTNETFNRLRLGDYRGRVDLLWFNASNPQSETTAESVDLTINADIPVSGPDASPANLLFDEITRDGYGVAQYDLSPYETVYLTVDASSSSDDWVGHLVTGGLQ